MARQTCELAVKALMATPISQFDGEAVLTHRDPRFVVALALEDTNAPFPVPNSAVTIPTHRVVFFAVHSVIQLFFENEIAGNRYRLYLDSELVNGVQKYTLRPV